MQTERSKQVGNDMIYFIIAVLVPVYMMLCFFNAKKLWVNTAKDVDAFLGG